MNEYHNLLEHRTKQFTRYLALMRERQRSIASGNSYIIFEERLIGDDDQGQRAASAAVVLEAVGGFFGLDSSVEGLEEITVDLPVEGWRQDDSGHRFVQFSFNPRYFDIDIPNTTLYRAEADDILRFRSGFFYVKECPQFEHPQENVARYNPIRKAYVHGDEHTAAEDMAYVFFHVWNFPVDWEFFVTADAFHERTDWEKGVALRVGDRQ